MQSRMHSSLPQVSCVYLEYFGGLRKFRDTVLFCIHLSVDDENLPILDYSQQHRGLLCQVTRTQNETLMLGFWFSSPYVQCNPVSLYKK